MIRQREIEVTACDFDDIALSAVAERQTVG